MQKHIKYIILLLLTSSLNLFSSQISLKDAQNIAKNWMLQNKGKEFSIDKDYKQNSFNSNKAYKIIKLKPRGWVIVASDDVATPILAYGESDIVDKTNQSFNIWMSGVKKEIKESSSPLKSFALKTIDPKEQNIKELWSKYKVDSKTFKDRLKQDRNNRKISRAKSSNSKVDPLLWLGGDKSNEISWDQYRFYNEKTPLIDNQHTYVGCVAVAMAQIMRYHKYPTRGTGHHSYYFYATDSKIGADFNHEYRWDNMPSQLYKDNSELSQLLYDVGISVDMKYGLKSSGAYNFNVSYALLNYFKYEQAQDRFKFNFDDDAWHSIMREELDEKRPIYYSGGNHAFVIDGYEGLFYHVNWGWGGLANGMFKIDNLTPYGGNYSVGQAMINIKPKSTSNIIKIYDLGLKKCVMQKLNISKESEITKDKAESLTNLECIEMGIIDIGALQYFTNLSDLHLAKNKIVDLTALKDLTSLTILSIYENKIESISPLKNLIYLKNLDIWNNIITDISALRDMNSLTYLDIGKNYIRDFSPIDHLPDDVIDHKNDQHSTSEIIEISDTNLQTCIMNALNVKNPDEIIKSKAEKLYTLNCQYRKITDLSGLNNFKNLSDLDLNNNNISDITALKDMHDINYLRLYTNNIKDISPLSGLTSLTYLDIWNNKIVDISPLSNKTDLNYLDIGENYIRDFTPIDHIPDDVIDHKYDQHNIKAPTNLTFSNITKTSVTLHWKDNSSNEDGFKIFRDDTYITTVGKNVQSYTDSNLKQNTKYRYTIKATKSD